jgi:beta-1,4-mannosyltransferase
MTGVPVRRACDDAAALPSPGPLLLAADPAESMLNPYLGMIFRAPAFVEARRVQAFRPGWPGRRAAAVHLHWPEYLLYGRLARRSGLATDLAYRRLTSAVDRVRAEGGRLVWTAHNLAPHGFPSPHGAAAYGRWSRELLARVDVVVAMSPAVEQAVRTAVPEVAGAQFVEIPHPHYRGHYGPAPDRARPPGPHLTVAAGLIRPYKRIPELIDAFSACARGDERLLVAGDCHDPRLRDEVLRRASPRVSVRIGPLDDRSFAACLRAADLFVANFAAALNSGSVLAALSLDTPVLAPRSGALADLQAQVGPDWLALFDGPLEPAVLRRHLDRSRDARPAESPDLARNAPERVIAAHLGLYT